MMRVFSGLFAALLFFAQPAAGDEPERVSRDALMEGLREAITLRYQSEIAQQFAFITRTWRVWASRPEDPYFRTLLESDPNALLADPDWWRGERVFSDALETVHILNELEREDEADRLLARIADGIQAFLHETKTDPNLDEAQQLHLERQLFQMLAFAYARSGDTSSAIAFMRQVEVSLVEIAELDARAGVRRSDESPPIHFYGMAAEAGLQNWAVGRILSRLDTLTASSDPRDLRNTTLAHVILAASDDPVLRRRALIYADGLEARARLQAIRMYAEHALRVNSPYAERYVVLALYHGLHSPPWVGDVELADIASHAAEVGRCDLALHLDHYLALRALRRRLEERWASLTGEGAGAGWVDDGGPSSLWRRLECGDVDFAVRMFVLDFRMDLANGDPLSHFSIHRPPGDPLADRALSVLASELNWRDVLTQPATGSVYYDPESMRYDLLELMIPLIAGEVAQGDREEADLALAHLAREISPAERIHFYPAMIALASD